MPLKVLPTRRSPSILLAGPLIAALMLTACGDDPAPPPPELDLATFETRLTELVARQLCEATFECPLTGFAPDEIPSWLRRHQSKEQCLASERTRASVDVIFRNLKGLREEGRVRFDGRAAYQCIEQLEQQIAAPGCAPARNSLPQSCDLSFVGARTQGQRCSLNTDCADGLECDNRGACGGQCVPRICGASTCTGAQTCVEDSTGQRFCLEPAKAGESCEALSCDRQSFCDRSMGEVICRPLGSRPANGACSRSRECVDNTSCEEGTCKIVAVLEEGAQCIPESSPVCNAGLVCTEAAFDAVASVLRGRCRAPRTAGQECFRDQECLADLRCVGANPGLGMAGSCSSLRANGERCERPEECSSGICQLNEAFESTCMSLDMVPQSTCPLMPAAAP